MDSKRTIVPSLPFSGRPLSLVSPSTFTSASFDSSPASRTMNISRNLSIQA